MTPIDIAYSATSSSRLARNRRFADQQLVDNSFTAPQVAFFLGKSVDEVLDMTKRRTLYAATPTALTSLTDVLYYPMWQFNPHTEDVVPGLDHVLAVLPVGLHPVDIVALMADPNEYLQYRSPIMWLQSGLDIATATEAVRRVTNPD